MAFAFFKIKGFKQGNLYCQYIKTIIILVSTNRIHIYPCEYVCIYICTCGCVWVWESCTCLETLLRNLLTHISKFIIYLLLSTWLRDTTQLANFLPRNKTPFPSVSNNLFLIFFWALASRDFNIHISTNSPLKAI